MNKQITDEIFGYLNELKVHKWLVENVDDSIIKRNGKWNHMDFECKDMLYELKSRRCFYKTFPDIMINLSKHTHKDNKPHTYLFLFKDGLYEWSYNENEFYVKYGGRQDRGKDERKKYGYVDIKYITLLTKDINSYISDEEFIKEFNNRLLR